MSRIFIADDHPIVQEALEGILRQAGHQIVGRSSTGAETLEMLPGSQADILLLDVQMPGGSGIAST